MSTRKPHPRQPIVWSKRPQDGRGGVIRFKANAIVRDLLDVASKHGLSLNDIACNGYSREDQEQLAQLIGYSVSGFGELSYASRRVVDEADREAATMYARRNGRRSLARPEVSRG